MTQGDPDLGLGRTVHTDRVVRAGDEAQSAVPVSTAIEKGAAQAVERATPRAHGCHNLTPLGERISLVKG